MRLHVAALASLILMAPAGYCADADLPGDASEAMAQAVEYLRDEVAVGGGYLGRYKLDAELDEIADQWGEGHATADQNWTQPPGNPSIGFAFLRAWGATGEQEYLDALARAESNDMYRFVAALEILNGRGTLKENTFAQRLAETMGMPGSGGTDSHQRTDIGKTATFFDADVTTERELVKAISSGRFWPVDRTGGDLTENPVHYDVPADLDAIWAQQAEQRRERELAGAPEFRDRPAEHPHVHA